MKHVIKLTTRLAAVVSLSLILAVGSVFVGVRPTGADGSNVLLFDNFHNISFKDENPNAKWFRYVNSKGQPDDPSIAKYRDIEGGGLRLEVNTKSVDDNYSNAEIATFEVGDGNSPYLTYGLNTRATVRMKYDPDMRSTPWDPGTALGSAGFLYWNASPNPGDLEGGGEEGEGNIGDAFGFTWQESRSSLPGLFAIGVVDGNFALAQPLPNVNMNVYNDYTIERTSNSVKYFVNGEQVAEVPVNQPGAPTLPDDHHLGVDVWVDNATYQYQFNGEEIEVIREEYHLPVKEYVDINYVKVVSLE